MGLLRTYSPDDLQVIIGGFPISGFAKGTFVSVERASDGSSLVTGINGTGARAKNRDRSGIVSLVLLQTSPSNDILSEFYSLDELSPKGQTLTLMVKDVTGSTIASSDAIWIKKLPKIEFSETIMNREWSFEGLNIFKHVGGN